jgi:hypothetical protein
VRCCEQAGVTPCVAVSKPLLASVGTARGSSFIRYCVDEPVTQCLYWPAVLLIALRSPGICVYRSQIPQLKER